MKTSEFGRMAGGANVARRQAFGGEQAEVFLNLGRRGFAVARERSELTIKDFAPCLCPILESLRRGACRDTDHIAKPRDRQRQTKLADAGWHSRQAQRTAMRLDFVLARFFVVEGGKRLFLLTGKCGCRPKKQKREECESRVAHENSLRERRDPNL